MHRTYTFTQGQHPRLSHRAGGSVLEGAAAKASAASSPLSSAWPIPSPVIGSPTPAASPQNRTRPDAGGRSPSLVGIGQARGRSAGVAPGPRTAAMWGRLRNSSQSRPRLPVRCVERDTPKPRCSPRRPAGGTTRRSPAGSRARTRRAVRRRPRVRRPSSTGGRRASRPGTTAVTTRASGAPVTTCRRRPRHSGCAGPGVGRREHHPVPLDAGALAGVAVEDRDAGLARQVHEGSVEVVALGGRGVLAAPGERVGHLPTRRRPDHQTGGRLPGRHRGRVEPEVLQQPCAPAVSPSPQYLSRGKHALSSTVTSRPARARPMAAAMPAGPAPTTATSATSGLTFWLLRLLPSSRPSRWRPAGRQDPQLSRRRVAASRSGVSGL